MGVLFERRAERRTSSGAPPIPSNSEAGGKFASASRRVDLNHTEASLQKIAVYASVRLLREVVNMLPIDFYSTRNGEQTEIAMPKWMEVVGGQGGLDGAGTTLHDWLGQVVYSDALRGNAYAKILARDPQTGAPRQLPLQHPDRVDAWRAPDGTPQWYFGGTQQDADDVWHYRSFPVPGSVKGVSPVGAHALTIGLGLSAEMFGAQFFIDGGHPTALFQNTQKTVEPDKAATIKKRITAVLSGNREPLVLGADWDYKPLQVAPNESQFLETNKYSSAECARIFGPGMPAVLGYETGGSLTYANIEQFNSQLLIYTLDPWLVRLERIVYDLLPRPQFVRFNRGALLRTDLLTRYRAHEIALRNEFLVVDEVRALEDRPPVAWGKEPSKTKTTPPVPVQMEP